MTKIAYIDKRFSTKSLPLIIQANNIIVDYQAQGYVLTLRQLFYQFVSRALLENTESNYNRLGSIINDARLAGLVDWEVIEDRTRGIEETSHWNDPSDIIESAAKSYHMDKWDGQVHRVECWIEKEALAGVFSGACEELDIPYLACRGYVSQSEMWRAANRLKKHEKNGCKTHILHFGDHDPSGIDMTRDIEDRLRIFGCDTTVERLALNFDQVEKHKPPPNPAKTTDSRFQSYLSKFGSESWELDALEPKLLTSLIKTSTTYYRNEKLWTKMRKLEEKGRSLLDKASARWEEVADLLEG